MDNEHNARNELSYISGGCGIIQRNFCGDKTGVGILLAAEDGGQRFYPAFHKAQDRPPQQGVGCQTYQCKVKRIAALELVLIIQPESKEEIPHYFREPNSTKKYLSRKKSVCEVYNF